MLSRAGYQPPFGVDYGARVVSRVTGAVAVVTGASSGIGAATAVELARRGATVVGVARRATELEHTMAACRTHTAACYGEVADVADRAAAGHVVTAAIERYGRVDIVVNNAGISLHKNAGQTTVVEIEHLFAVNFFGAVYLTMAALPAMLARGSGSIVNVTSVAGYLPNPGEAAYGASKAALSLWSHGLAVDLHDSGVHVGVLSPGPIDTEIWLKDASAATYRGRLFPPDVVAQGVARMIEGRRTHLTVPRRYGAVGALYPLLGRPMRWGLRAFAARGQRAAQR